MIALKARMRTGAVHADFKPYLVIGLALGGVYAMSGVGLVVLYRTTGVINLFYGDGAALASIVAWTMVDEWGWNSWLSYGLVILMAGVLDHLYGWFLGPPLAGRDPLIKACASARLRARAARVHAVAVDTARAASPFRPMTAVYVNDWLQIN